MKLRNKKTGETGYCLHTHRDHNTGTLKVAVLKDGVPFSEFKPHEPIYDYDSLAELNEDWEDYTPAEPLIKDEKIRKAVRAWAEAQGLIEAYCASNGYEIYGGVDGSAIQFKGEPFPFADKNRGYTITELCGEGER